jgi:hypothetical protein
MTKFPIFWDMTLCGWVVPDVSMEYNAIQTLLDFEDEGTTIFPQIWKLFIQGNGFASQKTLIFCTDLITSDIVNLFIL